MKVRRSTLPVIPGSTRNLLARGLSNNIACEMPNVPELVSGRHNNELLRSAQQDIRKKQIDRLVLLNVVKNLQ